MAKLYWRIKGENGKWTYKAADDVGKDADGFICVLAPSQEEE